MAATQAQKEASDKDELLAPKKRRRLLLARSVQAVLVAGAASAGAAV